MKLYNLLSVYNKSGIEIGLERSTSAPLFDPNQGSFSSLVLSYSGLGLNSKYHFIRPTFEYRRYIQTLPTGLFLLLELKQVQSFHLTMINLFLLKKDFILVGSSSIRGWERADLGPKDTEGKPVRGKECF